MKKLWIEKYKPEKFEDLILDDITKKKLKNILDNQLPVTLMGSPGIGKSAFVNIYINRWKADKLSINASLETSIDIIRDKVESFSKAYSKNSKVVVINEANGLSNHAMDSLKELIERTHDITRFLFISNEEHKKFEAIQSRCPILWFNNPPIKEVTKLIIDILNKEKIKILDKKSLVNIIKDTYPDIRQTITIIQSNIVDDKLKKIDPYNNELYSKILESIKEKDIDKVRTLLRSGLIDYDKLFQKLFNQVGNFENPGNAIIEIGNAYRWNSQVAIKEINFMTMVVEIILNGYV